METIKAQRYYTVPSTTGKHLVCPVGSNDSVSFHGKLADARREVRLRNEEADELDAEKSAATIQDVKPGRGGRRAGAGRPRVQQERDRAVTRSITLTGEEWDLLQARSKGKSYSKAVAALLSLP